MKSVAGVNRALRISSGPAALLRTFLGAFELSTPRHVVKGRGRFSVAKEVDRLDRYVGKLERDNVDAERPDDP